MNRRQSKAILVALTAAALCLSASKAQANLIAFYPFTGGSIADFSGNGNDGTFSAVAPTVTASGFQGEAFDFNGLNNTITIPVNINPTVMPQITFGAWVNSDVATGVIRGILSHDDVDFDRTIDMDTRGNGGGLRWSTFTGPGGGNTVANFAGPGGLVTAGEWVFLAVRHNQGTGVLNFHVNNMVLTLTGQTFGTGLNTTTIGDNPSFDTPFDGRIDNVFIFDRVVSDFEIGQIFTQGEAGIAAAAAAPEPGSALLALAGAGALVLGRRRHTR